MPKMTSLKIEPKHAWRPVGDKNPLVCAVRISSDDTSVETVLPDWAHEELLALCRDIVARAASEQVDAFCASVSPHMGKQAINHEEAPLEKIGTSK